MDFTVDKLDIIKLEALSTEITLFWIKSFQTASIVEWQIRVGENASNSDSNISL